jgi:hypothetical protein
MTPKPLPEITFPFGIKKTLIGIAFGTAALAALYCYLIFFTGDDHTPKRYFAIYIGIPVYLIWIIYSIVKIVRKSPVIRLNGLGLWWRGEMGGEDYFIPWQEITKFEANKLRFLNKAIYVFVQHPERFLSEKYSLRKGQEVRIKKIGTHIGIPINFIDKSPGDFLAILQNYQDVAQEKRGAKLLPIL